MFDIEEVVLKFLAGLSSDDAYPYRICAQPVCQVELCVEFRIRESTNEIDGRIRAVPAWTDQTHLSAKNIPELRQLIEAIARIHRPVWVIRWSASVANRLSEVQSGRESSCEVL